MWQLFPRTTSIRPFSTPRRIGPRVVRVWPGVNAIRNKGLGDRWILTPLHQTLLGCWVPVLWPLPSSFRRNTQRAHMSFPKSLCPRGGCLREYRNIPSPQLLPAKSALQGACIWSQEAKRGCQLSLTLPPWSCQTSLPQLSSLTGPLCRRCDDDSDNDDVHYLIISCFILVFYFI